MKNKLNWLDKFAQEQAKKLEKTASLNVVEEDNEERELIVDPEDVPRAKEGKIVSYNGKTYKVVKANYRDEKGPGVVLAQVYENYQDALQTPDTLDRTMNMAVGAPADSLKGSGKAQWYARKDKEETVIEETYTNDADAARVEQAAKKTQDKINAENAVDRTTVKGHYTSVSDDSASLDLGKSNVINQNIVDSANKITDAFVAETEKDLEDAEETVKKVVPARFAKKVLAQIEEKVDQEGIEIEFNKEVSKESLRKTASEDASEKELMELSDVVSDSIVESSENLLAEAEGILNQETLKIAQKHETYSMSHLASIENKLKSIVERKLKSVGIHARFDREYSGK
jgi:hypothetical protein